jgi:glycosyltransferase involved in cell wall biosynthesis
MDQGKPINKPKVSVIIPVYNTEAYVEEAVRSIMNQTLRDIEIIIIDDGSTDNSLSVIKRLALEDRRIKFYLQTNQGLSNTRNYGIKIASGEYIHFMDSDDVLASDAFEICHQICMKVNLDFIFFDACSFSEDNNISLEFDYHRTYLFEERKVYSGKEMLDIMLNENRYRASACLNFIKRNFVEQYKLKFYPDIIHEDELFTSELYLYAKRVSCIHKDLYYRRLRSDSIMMKKFAYKNIEGYLTIIKQLQLISKGDENFKMVIDKLISYILNPVIYNSKNLSTMDRVRVLFHCIHHKYLYYIKMKNRIVFLFPFLITIKSVLKKEIQ